jgi:hypothetical protein
MKKVVVKRFNALSTLKGTKPLSLYREGGMASDIPIHRASLEFIAAPGYGALNV